MSDQKRNVGNMDDQRQRKNAQPNQQDKQHSKNAGPRDNPPQPQQGRPSDQSQKNRDH